MGIPTLLFFMMMTVPVIFFALPSVFIGNPLNILFVIWWAVGGYGIYSGIYACIALDRPLYVLPIAKRIGIALGILAYTPLISFSFQGYIGFGVISIFVIRLAFLGLVPAIVLLALSFRRNIEQDGPPNDPQRGCFKGSPSLTRSQTCQAPHAAYSGSPVTSTFDLI